MHPTLFLLTVLVLVLAPRVYGAYELFLHSTRSTTPSPLPPSPPPPSTEQGSAAALDVKEALLIALTELLQRVAPAAESPTCPYPYTQVLHECFYPHSKKLSWVQARRVCQGMGGDLAEPRHIYALQTHMADTHGSGYFWVGGTCEGGDGTWRWVSGRPLDPEDWLFDRPDNQGGDEHCLEMVMSDYPRVFNDETCSLAQRFICQY
ncbi:perlucin-like [Eriocheir sinensis]|uniref:perlucin-like n=1 Tax=Eriocheir sinensis TaxID=95602 RepID=UPI0021C7A416|nr:perlucin-like [Eriocheir sinensis]